MATIGMANAVVLLVAHTVDDGGNIRSHLSAKGDAARAGYLCGRKLRKQEVINHQRGLLPRSRSESSRI